MSSGQKLRPPGGQAPPTALRLLDGGGLVDALPLAGEICRRYQAEFPDEQQRYGDAGLAWCVHDNLYLLYWGAETVRGHEDMHHEVAWLAGVLEARDFPLERLARSLDIAADVTRELVPGDPGNQLSAVLVRAAGFVRSRPSFLT